MKKIYETKKSVWPVAVDDAVVTIASGFLFRRNLMLAGLDHIHRRTATFSRLIGLILELAFFCNLNCTSCWTNNSEHQDRSLYLSVHHFDKIMNELGDYLDIIWFWGWGGTFLTCGTRSWGKSR